MERTNGITVWKRVVGGLTVLQLRYPVSPDRSRCPWTIACRCAEVEQWTVKNRDRWRRRRRTEWNRKTRMADHPWQTPLETESKRTMTATANWKRWNRTSNGKAFSAEVDSEIR